MATVFKAYQPSMDRYVALKVLPRFHSSDPEFLGRFEQEAKALAQLQHPHILPVFDYGESEGYTYFVMPLMQDGNLAELLLKEKLPLYRINQIISQIGGALEFAHSRGFIHRDIKPSNILMDESGNCMLMDFGIAKIIEGSKEFTRTGAILGTPAYMSPEQGSGYKIDHRSDIYSLGIILYEMVTGRPPFEAETPVAVIFKHVHEPLPPPSSIVPDLSEDIEKIILKSLVKDPDERYQNVRDMVDAFAKAVTASIKDEATMVAPPATIQEHVPSHEESPPTLLEEGPATQVAPLQTQPEIASDVDIQTTTQDRIRLLRPALYLIGAIMLILVGVWLSGSGLFSSSETESPEETMPVAAVATEISNPTDTPIVETALVIPPVTETDQPPISTHTPSPSATPPYQPINTMETPGTGLEVVIFIAIDSSIYPFDNYLVRRAFASAIDRTSLIDLVITYHPGKEIVPATNFTPPDILGFDLYDEVGYRFDMELAQQSLAEAGYPNGEGFPAITLYHRDREARLVTAQHVSASLSDVLGINVYTSATEITYPDIPAFYLMGWQADYLAPPNFLHNPFCGKYNNDFLGSDDYYSLTDSINVERDISTRNDLIREYSDKFCLEEWNPHIDLSGDYKRLVDQALGEMDQDSARLLYVELDRILTETDIHLIPLYHRSS
jgi:hypothetical protein